MNRISALTALCLICALSGCATTGTGDRKIADDPGPHATPAASIAPAASPALPRIHGAAAVGARAGNPFEYRIPATGEAPLHFSASGLPDGVSIDPQTGILSGVIAKEAKFSLEVTVSNPLGSDQRAVVIDSRSGTLGLTPALGWNSWNAWGCDVDDQKIRAAADRLVSTGLAAHGFQYVNIDDCWQAANRNADGSIQPDPARFPDMKSLADYVHSKGLKIGIYSSPGPKTCQGYPGSLGHEAQDAQTYSQWGIDYLKYDWCSYAGPYTPDPYQRMGEILKKQSRDIYFSICQYGGDSVWQWGASVGGNSWRTTGDINDSWAALLANGFSQNDLGVEPYAGPGHWNDPDMLVVGVGTFEGNGVHPSLLTQDEQVTQITLWSMLAAPLLIGADLTRLDDFTLALLENDEVLAVDQDVLGKEATRVLEESGMQVYTRPLADGSTAIAVFNMTEAQASYAIPLSGIGLSGTWRLRDLWRHQDLGMQSGNVNVTLPAHGSILLRTSANAPKAKLQIKSER